MNVAQDQTLAKQEKFIALRAGGDSFRTIAKKLKVSKDTCKKWECSFSDRVSEARKERLEAVYIQFGMMKEARIKGLGARLQKIEEELDKRDLSDVPSDKLLDMALKYRATLKEEFTPLQASEKQDLVGSIKESVSTLTTRIASGELGSDALKIETASLLALEKVQASLPQETKDNKFEFKIMTAEESLQERLQTIRLQAEIMLSDDKQRELVNEKLNEIEGMKQEYENLISSEKWKKEYLSK